MFQAIIRYAFSHGLQTAYRDETRNVQLVIRLLIVPLLPEEKMLDAFQVMS